LIMTTYAIEKSSSGDIIGCRFWSAEKVELPAGFSACSPEEYASAKAGLKGSVRNQAIDALTVVQRDAALTVAMGHVFGAETRKYVQALQGIASGSDTVTRELPARPAQLTD